MIEGKLKSLGGGQAQNTEILANLIRHIIRQVIITKETQKVYSL